MCACAFMAAGNVRSVLYNRLKEVLSFGREVSLPALHDVSSYKLTICDIFRTRYIEKCKVDVIACYWYASLPFS